MTTAQDALKSFQSSGDVQEAKPKSMQSAPGIRLHPTAEQEPSEFVGKFLVGKYLGRREAKGPNGKLVFIDIRLQSTNAQATIKEKEKYKPVAVKENDIVSLLAPTRLDRALSEVTLGREVYINYEGMKRVKTTKGVVNAHTFTVLHKQVTLTQEDRDIIARNSQVKASKADAEAVKVLSEAEAEEALAQLED